MTALFRTTLLLLLLFLLRSFSLPQRFSVTIILPAGTNLKNLSIRYDNGTRTVEVPAVFKNNKLLLSDTFVSRYATISIYYSERNEEQGWGGSYWVNSKPAVISFARSWDHPELVNARSLEAENNRFKAFVAGEIKEKDDYWEAHNTAILELNTPERQVFFKKLKAIEDKKLLFVKQNKASYYSFWLFRDQIVYIGKTVPYGYKGNTAADLRDLFNAIYPDSLKRSAEGREILTLLAAKEIRPGAMAAGFTTTDVQGRKISLSDYKGKYVLLNFWASWCAPCVAELPAIGKIYNSYRPDQLQVIGISSDKDSVAFANAVEKYKMNWINIRDKESINHAYAVYALPYLFLIDPSGKIIYERQEEEPQHIENLPLLQQKLKTLLPKQQNTHPGNLNNPK